MYSASSAVSAPPRPAYPAVAEPAVRTRPQPRLRRGTLGGAHPLSGRLDLSGPQGAQLRTAVAAVHRICPEFHPVQVLRRSGRSVLLVGTSGRSGAVVPSACWTSHPLWAERFRHEITSYRAFVRNRPPVRVPRLVAADPAAARWCWRGFPAVRPRCPAPVAGAAPRADVRTVLGAITPAQRVAAAGRPVRRSARLRVADLPLPRAGPVHRPRPGRPAETAARHRRRPAHGPSVLPRRRPAVERPAVADRARPGRLGAPGWYLPGYDLATLWTVLGDDAAGPPRGQQAGTGRRGPPRGTPSWSI